MCAFTSNKREDDDEVSLMADHALSMSRTHWAGSPISHESRAQGRQGCTADLLRDTRHNQGAEASLDHELLSAEPDSVKRVRGQQMTVCDA